MRPNVLGYPFDFPTALAELAPNRPYAAAAASPADVGGALDHRPQEDGGSLLGGLIGRQRPRRGERPRRGLLLVSLGEIADGDELLLNYRYAEALRAHPNCF